MPHDDKQKKDKKKPGAVERIMIAIFPGLVGAKRKLEEAAKGPKKEEPSTPPPKLSDSYINSLPEGSPARRAYESNRKKRKEDNKY